MARLPARPSTSSSFRLEQHRVSRRAFLAGCLASVCGSRIDLRAFQREPTPPFPRRDDRGPLARMGAQLQARYRDLPSHFIFEYYPWYGTSPWRHWDQAGAIPPQRIGANYLPLLGPYDSRSTRVIEQHARWILQAGAGAINVSWWGQGSYEDRTVPIVMDVMKDYGIQVAFHMEPYAKDRALRFADDIKYLIREYGERRRWDNFLLLEWADGSAAPVFEMFEAILPATSTDCLGITRAVPGYVPDAVWRQQTTTLKRELAGDFEHLTVLADSLDVERTRDAGFDGGTSSDPYFHPDRWQDVARAFDDEDLLFVFGTNAGFDAVPAPGSHETDPCYRPRRTDPLPDSDWTSEQARAREQQASSLRIFDSFHRSLRLQTEEASTNARRGFFLAYLNSFNEWHEGTQFEPMKSLAELTSDERRIYHNTQSGSYRLDVLGALLQQVV